MNLATQRPRGVTILAGLNFLAVIPLVVSGTVLMIQSVLEIRQVLSEENSEALPIVLSSFVILLGLVLAAVGAAGILVGIGLLRLRNWARMIALGIAVLLLSFSATLTLLSLSPFDPLRTVAAITGVAYNGWILWYLRRPDLKQSFGVS